MKIIEKKRHKDKIQNFLDYDKGVLTIKIAGKTYYAISYEIMKAYIEEQEQKNDYLEKKILKLERKMKNFLEEYENDRCLDEFRNKISRELE